MRMFLLPLLICLLLACTAKRQEQIALEITPQGAYVILPSNFIIDLAAGSEVHLNPNIQTFAIFSSAAEAREALDGASAQLPAGSQWSVYRLKGAFADMGKDCGSGRMCLRDAAQVDEWVEI